MKEDDNYYYLDDRREEFVGGVMFDSRDILIHRHWWVIWMEYTAGRAYKSEGLARNQRTWELYGPNNQFNNKHHHHYIRIRIRIMNEKGVIIGEEGSYLARPATVYRSSSENRIYKLFSSLDLIDRKVDRFYL